MKNSLCLGVLAVTCLGLGAANAQPPAVLPPVNVGSLAPLPSVPFADSLAPTTPTAPLPQSALNEYLAYPRPNGSTGYGPNGLIGGEIYLRSGIAINTGGSGIFSKIYGSGFEIEGGVRSVFFRPDPSTAWTIDVGLSNVFFHNRSTQTANIRNFTSTTTVNGTATSTVVPLFPVTPGNLNQTAARLALGQEYYLFGDADPADGGIKWRAGWDAGGTLGTSKLDVAETTHRNGMIGGILAAAHSDVEVPYGQCILQAGFRAEYRYTWSDILKEPNDTNLSTISLMFTTGVRF